MTAKTVKAAREGESNGEGLRGSPIHADGQGILGDIMTPKRPAHPSTGQEQSLSIPGSVIKSSERPTTVVGEKLSRKSRVMTMKVDGGHWSQSIRETSVEKTARTMLRFLNAVAGNEVIA